MTKAQALCLCFFIAICENQYHLPSAPACGPRRFLFYHKKPPWRYHSGFSNASNAKSHRHGGANGFFLVPMNMDMHIVIRTKRGICKEEGRLRGGNHRSRHLRHFASFSSSGFSSAISASSAAGAGSSVDVPSASGAGSSAGTAVSSAGSSTGVSSAGAALSGTSSVGISSAGASAGASSFGNSTAG